MAYAGDLNWCIYLCQSDSQMNSFIALVSFSKREYALERGSFPGLRYIVQSHGLCGGRQVTLDALNTSARLLYSEEIWARTCGIGLSREVVPKMAVSLCVLQLVPHFRTLTVWQSRVKLCFLNHGSLSIRRGMGYSNT